MAAPISYTLPLSTVRVSGKVEYTTDKLVTEEQKPVSDATTELVVLGDTGKRLRVDVEAVLKDSTASFEFTPDGRLVSSVSKLTGAGGKVVSGIIGIASTVIGIAAGTAVRGVTTPGGFTVQRLIAGGEDVDEAAQKAAEDAISEAYQRDHPDASALRSSLQAAVKTAGTQHATAATALADASTDAAIKAATRRLRATQIALNAARAELERAETHFAAWRASQISKRTEAVTFELTMDELTLAGAAVSDGSLTFHPISDPWAADVAAKAVAEATDAWERLNSAVVIRDPLGAVNETWANLPMETHDVGAHDLVVRLPRPVTIDYYHRTDDGKAELVSSKPVLVLDRRCPHIVIGLTTNLFGKTNRTLKFTEDGVLKGYELETTSALGAAFEAAAAIPGSVASGLEQATNVSDRIGTLQMAAIDREMDRVTKELALKQQELAMAGVNATAGTFVELEQLKRQADLLSQQKIVAETGRALSAESVKVAEMEAEVSLLKAQLQRVMTQAAIDGRGVGGGALTVDDLKVLLG